MPYRGDVLAYVESVSALARRASEGPWYVRSANDSHCMSAGYVTPVAGDAHEWTDTSDVVAVTLLQEPEYAVSTQHSENAEFIAEARTAVPRLCSELEDALRKVDRLRTCLRALIANARESRTTPPSGSSENLIAEAERVLAWVDRPWWTAE